MTRGHEAAQLFYAKVVGGAMRPFLWIVDAQDPQGATFAPTRGAWVMGSAIVEADADPVAFGRARRDFMA